ncbi:MAG TPA: PIN domain-containing protein [Stellaceae bacterium]|nr:PIN domain-containing protein [Stellaceae bacterium]
MIYLDSSVALAYLFDEDRQPAREFWHDDLCSSQLLEYEVWNRVHARRLASSLGENVQKLLAEISLFQMSVEMLSRALEPFPIAVRTLDALHLATIVFVRDEVRELELASYDDRLNAAARTLHIPLRAM